MANAIEQTQPRPEAPAVPPPRKDARRQGQSKPKRQPPYAVVLHNDPVNTLGYVVGVLCQVFRYGRGKAFLLTLRAHLGRRGIVWTGSLEVAELKAQQIRDCGPDPAMIDEGARPLKATIEPLPE